ncbi:hypothetical protein CEUSTIGMA_g4262.t1 [Chlamydomonas eustigma]|uniref:magnesium chelatase n=1 Tax=Chlamydomonas eustigma TaxID=1157962 RepID=A0A250X191_9CHLO|nr:hypothetical protein CEUSTIGMA_g4262.t1 [Chlamydomonas eustigma]|eukprot:GAX76816.1 hypothetical protein CEUSTIGMA_g4262.t1 [Chlamydomonas eustigma]
MRGILFTREFDTTKHLSNRSRVVSVERTIRCAKSFPCPTNHVLGNSLLHVAMHINVSRSHKSTLQMASAVGLKTEAEQFIESVSSSAKVGEEGETDRGEQQLSAQLVELESKASSLTLKIDQLYSRCFSGLEVRVDASSVDATATSIVSTHDTETPSGHPASTERFEAVSEASFRELGQTRPQVMKALLTAKEVADPRGWQSFQANVHMLKLQRSRIEREAQELSALLGEAERSAAKARALNLLREAEGEADVAARIQKGKGSSIADASGVVRPVRIVLITGFESFNLDLYNRVAELLSSRAPGVLLKVFSDRDVLSQRSKVEAALKGADVFFGSLIFDYDQVEWLRAQIQDIPVRLVFESALELMGSTQIGSFNMAPNPSGEKKGPPPIVQKVLSMFGSKREEDKMVGYLSFLKIGPKLLKFVPGKKAADLKNWLTIYGYWNQGGLSNVVSMFLYLLDAYRLQPSVVPPEPLVETPALGCLHPMYHGGRGYFGTPAEYMKWYQREGPLRGSNAPVAAVLLYRKHVVTEQPYIAQLISQMESEGVLPIPIFINGVEAHTVVRDLLTTQHERQLVAKGGPAASVISPTLKLKDAAEVDAVISTIGFPLVGGPAGSMEGGRQADIAKGILSSKNVPYVVAAPLLIQDMASWTRDGISGLQSVVLYSLPELDGAIDTVPLGGLVGDAIYLVPERVKKLAARVRRWVNLRRKPAHERKVAMLVYGFPPGVGATGTAALLNVPRSLEKLLSAMRAEGYDLGGGSEAAASSTERVAAAAASDHVSGGHVSLDGEALVTGLRLQEDQRAVSEGVAGLLRKGVGEGLSHSGFTASAAEVTAPQLKSLLTYPESWGPTEWGPIPFLPDNDILVKRVEKQWGDLRGYRGMMTSAQGGLVVPGLKAGNIFLGVQPALGIEGDPMRLLFERDLTPHPQYAAFYKWLEHEFKADVVLHFGMHGTVEWLPGAPLGNTGFSWSDVLLGEMPNVYIYACNNPSESIIAKRRGYGTIVSHNVPPYGRSGLYKQLNTLKELLVQYRESPDSSSVLKEPIIDTLNLTGLQEDCPYEGSMMPADAVTSTNRVQEQSEQHSLSPHSAQGAPASASSGSPKQNVGNGASASQFKQSRPEGSFFLRPEDAERVDDSDFEAYCSKLYMYLQVVEGRLFSEGLHVLGTAPSEMQMEQYLSAYFGNSLPPEAIQAVAGHGGEGLQAVRSRLERQLALSAPSSHVTIPIAGSSRDPRANEWREKLEEAVTIRQLLMRNTEEIDSVLRAMNGEYVLPEAGGDLLRDGAGVLPTGRNIHALDPYRMPSSAARQRGAEVAAAILEAHKAANAGMYPETVAVNLWGLDAIKTKGESVGIVLHMVGARPVTEGTGRVARFELIPLEELGRPRVDVLCNMSGIFRDSFQNVVELLDDLFQRAATAPGEPIEMNYIKKHTGSMKAEGLDNPGARLFSNPAGDYGSMVNERIGASSWENGEELGDTWASRNSYSYGRGGERGRARPEVLQGLLSTCERVVQEVDSVEYGLTDIQEYYANTGALKRAAQSARGGKAVGCSIVEAYGKDVKPRELEEVLRLEYRSKLLNPKWAEAMAAQGSGGAFEISQRMTAMVGWGATAGFAEDWTWQQSADMYILDPEMSARLRKANPQAYSNVLKRMLEAAGRGIWNASPDMVQKLREAYAEMDDELEGVRK